MLIFGLLLFITGLTCNILVFNANGKAMPVNVPSSEVIIHNSLNQLPHISSVDNKVKLKVLSDFIGAWHFSIGDILIVVGYVLSSISGIVLAVRWDKDHKRKESIRD
jgi:hypothetical protein